MTPQPILDAFDLIHDQALLAEDHLEVEPVADPVAALFLRQRLERIRELALMTEPPAFDCTSPT